MEFGRRALGSRSILADPRDPKMKVKVNNAVKFREWWRPFAPSLKKEAAGEYPESATGSPFLLPTAREAPPKRAPVPSAPHLHAPAPPPPAHTQITPPLA